MALLSASHARLAWAAFFIMLLGLPLAAEAVVAQAFTTTSDLSPGELVALEGNNSQSVTLASDQNAASLTGVVASNVGQSEAGVASNQVLVASSGAAYVLVSDINGPISKGNYVTTSNLAGVGARAIQSGIMIGTAQVGFTGHESGDLKTSIKIGDKTQTVHIGQIPVQLVVGPESLNNGGLDSYIPPGVQSLADTIAGHPVAALRLVMAAMLILIGLVGSSVILYAAIRNSIVSIGRNPLARRYVYRGLLQVMIIVLFLLLLCLGGVFLIITLS